MARFEDKVGFVTGGGTGIGLAGGDAGEGGEQQENEEETR